MYGYPQSAYHGTLNAQISPADSATLSLTPSYSDAQLSPPSPQTPGSHVLPSFSPSPGAEAEPSSSSLLLTHGQVSILNIRCI